MSRYFGFLDWHHVEYETYAVTEILDESFQHRNEPSHLEIVLKRLLNKMSEQGPFLVRDISVQPFYERFGDRITLVADVMTKIIPDASQSELLARYKRLETDIEITSDINKRLRKEVSSLREWNALLIVTSVLLGLAVLALVVGFLV